MAPATDDERPISGRLKKALIADLVFGDDRRDDGWLTDPLRDPWAWTTNLGRQLGFVSINSSIHETLLVVVREVDRMLGEWSFPQEPAGFAPLAETATRHLDPIEVYATVLAGPRRWGGDKLAEGTVENLPKRLQAILARELANELCRVFASWVTWDIRDWDKLEKRRREILKEREERDRSLTRTRSPLPIPPPPPRKARSAEERLKALEDERGPSTRYVPPGRS